MEINEQLRQQLSALQRNKITEHLIYTKLANTIHPSQNKQILEQIAADELRHYRVLLSIRKRRSSRIG